MPPIFFRIFKFDMLLGEEAHDPSTGANMLGELPSF
jgi:hypothetical protein